MDHPEPGGSAAQDLYRSLADLAYTMAGNRAHMRLRVQAEVTVDRASLALLRTLTAAPSPLRMGEIAQALLVQAPHVTREIRGLEERGLVRTVREPDDHRARRIAVTEEGREVVERAEEAGRRWLDDALRGFAPHELTTAAAVISRVVEAYRNP
ncbi:MULTISPECIES: MarR family winged helix-turn-helix transcriptional regulator [unclassified Streptomyces]|uniref:MarR family winged helix-turn-helix transcriptional regulator n=1 Tax=unclassified Streptomyces TaxID=2593676 RepID=UPI002E243DFF|nr:MarR family transcriptional regulator [Streptomyces sp. NBC_01023]